MIVDWQVYYDAAKKCHDLAADLRRADKPLHDAVKGECAGMAGDAPGCKQWGETYDRFAHSTMQTCTNLADALTNYGYVLYTNGYNYGINNKSNPPPPRPDVRAVTEYKVTIPTSVRDNGAGVEHNGGVGEFFAVLVTKILEEFGKLPNGDVGKLDRAATTWDSFAKNDTITGAAARISAIAAVFDGMDDRVNRELIQGQFTILRTGAEHVATASVNVAAPVASYHSGIVDVSKGIQSAITTAEWAIGLIVGVAAATALLSFGGSLAAGGGGVTVAVGETISTIRNLYQASNLIRVVGLTAAAAGAVGVIGAFDKVPDLTSISTSLATIIAMRVLIDEGQTGTNPKPSTNTDARDLPEGFTLPPEVVADKIAEHGARKDRSIPGVADADLPEYIEKIIETPGYRLRDTPSGTPRMGWWDEETGTMIIREGNNGTFFQPDEGYEYFRKELAE